MDPINNPFSPGAGSRPHELVGRDPVLEQARILLGRIKQNLPAIQLTASKGVVIPQPTVDTKDAVFMANSPTP